MSETVRDIASGPADTGVYIGVHDELPGRTGMRRHTIAAEARRNQYLEPPDGPGGHWAYALCKTAAYYYEDATSHVKALPECADCATARGAAGTSNPEEQRWARST